MNLRQKKKHYKKAFKYAWFSIELAERYLTKYSQANKYKGWIKL